MSEESSELTAELWSSRLPVASSILSYPEGRAALAAARRIGRLSRPAFDRAVAQFENAQRALVVVGIDEALARDAGELADKLGLRGYGAVHLASALALGTDETTVVTWDRDLSHAATRAGLPVVPGL